LRYVSIHKHWKRRKERRRLPMCYTNRNRGFEDEAHRLRLEEEDRRRRQERRHAGEEKQDKPLTEKVKEMVGAR
jgi:hypothetical protein